MVNWVRARNIITSLRQGYRGDPWLRRAEFLTSIVTKVIILIFGTSLDSYGWVVFTILFIVALSWLEHGGKIFAIREAWHAGRISVWEQVTREQQDRLAVLEEHMVDEEEE
jgi:hypothetical protein